MVIAYKVSRDSNYALRLKDRHIKDSFKKIFPGVVALVRVEISGAAAETGHVTHKAAIASVQNRTCCVEFFNHISFSLK